MKIFYWFRHGFFDIGVAQSTLGHWFDWKHCKKIVLIFVSKFGLPTWNIGNVDLQNNTSFAGFEVENVAKEAA